MIRIAPLMVAGALSLAVATPASAQINLSFGNGGSVLSLGQPSYATSYGYAPGYTSYPGVYSPYVNQTAPYGYSYSATTPYTTGTTYYSSGYQGYVTGTTYVQQQSYATPLYNTYRPTYGYGVGQSYGVGYGNIYRGGLNYNRGFGRGFGRIR